MRRNGLQTIEADRRKRISPGFTLAELLITVAIIGILTAFGFVAVVQAHRNLRLREMDDAAREIFVAAQNHLTAAKASGKWSVFYDCNKDTTDAASVLGDVMTEQPSDYPSTDTFDAASHDYRVVEFDQSTDDPQLLDILLPAGSVDSSLLPGDAATGPKIRIEYDAKSASIYAVWYTDGKTGLFSLVSSATTIPLETIADGRPTNSDGTVTDTDDARKTRRDSDPTVGYYGGAAAIEPENAGDSASQQTLTGITAAVSSRTTSDDRLFVKVSGIKADTNGNMPTVQIQIKGVTSGVSASLIELDTDKTHYTGSLDQDGYYENQNTASDPDAYALYLDEDWNYYCLLDSVSDGERGHFASRFPGLIPGENLDITVTATLGSAQKSIRLHCNSLFASVENKDGNNYSVQIETPRHLQNLSCDVSKLSTDPTGEGKEVDVVSASLGNDLDWTDYYRSGSDTDDWKTINVLQPDSGSVSSAATGCFYSINNPTLLSFDGNGYRLQNFVLTGDANHPVGLFGSISGRESTFSVANLTLSSCSTDNDTASADASARSLLVGAFAAGKNNSGLSLSNVALNFSGDVSVASSSQKQAAGLLVGSFDGQKETAPLRMQQIRITGSGNASLSGENTGLLAGTVQNANGTVTLSNITASLGSLSLQAEDAAGGLVGSLEGTSALSANSIALTLTGSTAADMDGASAAGGLFGSAACASADLENLSLSFSSGTADIASSGGAAGGMVGILTAESNAALSQLTLSGASEEVTGKTAAGGLAGDLEAGGGLTADTLGASITNGSLVVQAEAAGGLAGRLLDTGDASEAMTLSNCSAASANAEDLVRGTRVAGGLVGEISLSNDRLILENSHASLYVHTTGESGDNPSAGGLLGALTGTSSSALIRYCYSGGRTANGSYVAVTGDTDQGRYNVQGDSTAAVPGGFLGYLGQGISAALSTCYTTSSVYGAGTLAGSFVGSLQGTLTISNSYSTGLVMTKEPGSSTIGFVGSGTATVPADGKANAILAGVSGVDQSGNAVANQYLSGAGVASLVYTGAAPFDQAAATDTGNASPVDLSLQSVNASYPYETIAELAGSGAEGVSSSMKRHVGDWPTGSQAGTSVTAVNGNKLTIHVALPISTEYFTMAVEGLADVSLEQRIYYAPFHVEASSDGTYKITWEDFFRSQWLSDFTVHGFQNSSNSGNITTCQIAHAESAADYQAATGQELQAGQYALAIDLDDLSQSEQYEAGPFAALFSGMNLYPGEDICVRVKTGVEKFATIGFDTSAEATVNSIYADGSNWTAAAKSVTGSDGSSMTVAAHTALVANARHLLNLSTDMNLAGKTDAAISYTAAEQTADIVWTSSDQSTLSYVSDITARNSSNGTYQKAYGIETYWYNGSHRIAKNGTFYPIVNSSLASYDGNGHVISRIVINGDDFGNGANTSTLGGDGAGNAGLFKTVADGFALTDLTVQDITATTPSSFIATAGILVSGTNVTFTNVTLKGDVTIASQSAGSCGSVPAGGLIGTASGSVQLENCRVESDALEILGGTSGGLVGTMTGGSLSIDSCLVLRTKLNAQSAAVIANGSSSDQAGGGLIGSASVTSLAIHNSAASVQVQSLGTTGVSAGGLSGRLVISGAGTISNSYSAGRTQSGAYNSSIPGVQGTVTSYANTGYGLGGLIGYASGKLTISDSFSTASVLAAAGSSGYVDAEGGLIGHAEGSVRLGRCYSTGRVSHTGTAASGVTSGAFLGSGAVTAEDCAYLDGINAASMQASSTGAIAGVSAADPSNSLIAAGTDTTTANTHPYDSTLSNYPYWNKTTVKKSTDANKTGISFYGDWPVPATPVYAGLLYYENVNGTNADTSYYNGYVKAVNRTGSYQAVTQGSMATAANTTLSSAGYRLAVESSADTTDLYLGLGSVASGRSSDITPVALQNLTSSGTITANGVTYNLYEVGLDTFSGADASLYSASNMGADLVLLQKDADSGDYEETASFGYVPFFADTVTVPDGSNGSLPATTAKTFTDASGAVSTSYGYIIRSAGQLTDLAGEGAGQQYLTDSTGKNIVIEQRLDITFSGSEKTPVITTLGSNSSGSSVTLRSAVRGSNSGEHYVITGLTNTLVTTITQAGTIQDIRIESSDIAGNGLAETNNGTITGCILQNDAVTGNGLVGTSTGTIQGSRIQNSTILSGAGFAGTIAGGSVTGCDVINALVSGSGFAQTISGGTVSDCQIYGDASLYSSYTKAFSASQLRYTPYGGSTTGSAYALVRIGSTAASPDLTNASDNVAGFAAEVQGYQTAILNCSVTGEVYGKPNAAGFVFTASNGAGIRNSYANTIVSAYRKTSTDTTVASGFAGSVASGASISYCHALGVLSSTNGRAAGFAGSLVGWTPISNSYTAVWQAQVDRAADYSLFAGSQSYASSGNYAMGTLFVNGLQNSQTDAGSGVTLTDRSGLADVKNRLGGQVSDNCTFKYGTYNTDASDTTYPFGIASGMSAYGDWPPASASRETVQVTQSHDSVAKYGLYETEGETTSTGGPFAIEAVVYRYGSSYRYEYYLTRNGQRICSFHNITRSDNSRNMVVNNNLTSDILSTTWTSDVRYVSIEDYLNTTSAMTGNSKNVYELHYTRGQSANDLDSIAGSDTTCIITMRDGTVYVTNTVQQIRVGQTSVSWNYTDSYTRRSVSAAAGITLKRYSVEVADGTNEDGTTGVQATLRFVDTESAEDLQNLSIRYDWYELNSNGTLSSTPVQSTIGTAASGDFLPFTSMTEGTEYVCVATNITNMTQNANKYQNSWYAESKSFAKVTASY